MNQRPMAMVSPSEPEECVRLSEVCGGNKYTSEKNMLIATYTIVNACM
ncbi:hypothetical protein THOM_0344 [Trachipleistophora hominis]|uniref:Uncharacterized protein n=1 Tax=Trachipleistophora hominis TaxID=72359 RepID=L7JYT9_TRAHO|nr:hypothetical protein THOM_0344 [Trachipleistophora hominis]